MDFSLRTDIWSNKTKKVPKNQKSPYFHEAYIPGRKERQEQINKQFCDIFSEDKLNQGKGISSNWCVCVCVYTWVSYFYNVIEVGISNKMTFEQKQKEVRAQAMWISGGKTFLILSIEVKWSDSYFYRIILTTFHRIDGRRSKAEAERSVREPSQ